MMISNPVNCIIFFATIYLFSTKTEAYIEECICSRQFKPICGTNELTYENECKLNCAKIFYKDLKIQYNGTCCPKPTCQEYFDPLCDDTGKTHQNECLFRYAYCITRRKDNKILGIRKKGECVLESNCTNTCDTVYKPVCDASNITHKNICELEQFNCLQRKENKTERLKAYDGECQDSNMKIDFAFEDRGERLIDDEKERNSSTTHNDHRQQFSSNRMNLIKKTLANFEPEALQLTTSKFDHGHDTLLVTPSTHIPYPKAMGSIIENVSGLPINIGIKAGINKFLEKVTPIPRFKPSLDFYDKDPFTSEEMDDDMNYFNIDLLRETYNIILRKLPLSASFAVPNDEFQRLYFVNGSNDAIKNEKEKHYDENETLCSMKDCTNQKFDPICDSNNRTHKNPCFFEFYKCLQKTFSTDAVGILYKGVCSTQMAVRRRQNKICNSCDDEEEKILLCDNLNKTHRSICSFNSFNCQQRKIEKEERVLVHLGSCRSNSPNFDLSQEVCPTRCPRHYRPVCNAHGKTHRNLCSYQIYSCNARKKKIKDVAELVSLNQCYKNKGVSAERSKSDLRPKISKSNLECPTPHCNNTKNPICDNEGRIHKNECAFAWHRCMAAKEGRILTAAHDEFCKTNLCDAKCKMHYEPVCSSNFITYPNRCMFDKARCLDGTIELLYNGECRECFKSVCPELTIDEPDSEFVCDQSGESKSKCEFEMLRCIYEKKYGYNITIAYKGKCCPSEQDCPTVYKPVCDSKGITHKNKCNFEITQCRSMKIHGQEISIMEENACKPSRLFTVTTDFLTDARNAPVNKTLTNLNCDDHSIISNDPICGSDYVTYINECALKAMNKEIRTSKKITVAYRGECCFDMCPNNWNPVCDSQGVTNKNLCEFGVRRCVLQRTIGLELNISAYKECSDKRCLKVCSHEYEPICASNGHTYKNLCEMNQVNCLFSYKDAKYKQLELDYKGECCVNNCDYTYAPVCDRDGKTHVNLCVFRYEACLANRRFDTNLTIKYEGQCCDETCDSTYAPICANMQTYENMCKFRLASCEAIRRGEEELIPLHMGECCQIPAKNCSLSGEVCDNEGKTHQDICNFIYEQCIRKRQNKDPIFVAYQGECCKSSCDDEKLNMICDQNGQYYTNNCTFELASCESQRKNGKALLRIECNANIATNLFPLTHDDEDE